MLSVTATHARRALSFPEFDFEARLISARYLFELDPASTSSQSVLKETLEPDFAEHLPKLTHLVVTTYPFWVDHMVRAHRAAD